MKASEVVDRARSQIRLGTTYVLGKGGFNPRGVRAANSAHACDCSGFASWCLGVSRKTDNPFYQKFNGGWFETTAIVRDALAQGVGMFDDVPWGDAKPGMLVVWGDSGGHQGHVGVVSEVDEKGPTRVVHCSSGNFRNFGDAICETSSQLFKDHSALVARCAWVEWGTEDPT